MVKYRYSKEHEHLKGDTKDDEENGRDGLQSIQQEGRRD